MTGPWRLALGCVAALLVGAFLAGRCSAPPVAGPSRDSLALVAAADSLRTTLDSTRTLLTVAAEAAARGASALRVVDSLRRARRGATLPPRPGPATPPDSVLPFLWERVDSLESHLVQAEAEADSATAAAYRYRDAHRQAVEAASILIAQATSAEGRLNQAAVQIGRLEGQLRRQRNGVRVGLAVDGVAAGDGWAVLAGPVVAARRTVLGIETEASLTAGWGVGGRIGEAPATGPGVGLRVAVTF